MTPAPSAVPLTAEELVSTLRGTLSRVQFRIDAILERDGTQEAAITGAGIGISYLLATDIAFALQRGVEAITKLTAERDGFAADASHSFNRACEYSADLKIIKAERDALAERVKLMTDELTRLRNYERVVKGGGGTHHKRNETMADLAEPLVEKTNAQD